MSHTCLTNQTASDEIVKQGDSVKNVVIPAKAGIQRVASATHMNPQVFPIEPLLDSCRADALRWIPAFAGMTIFFMGLLPFTEWP